MLRGPAMLHSASARQSQYFGYSELSASAVISSQLVNLGWS